MCATANCLFTKYRQIWSIRSSKNEELYTTEIVFTLISCCNAHCRLNIDKSWNDIGTCDSLLSIDGRYRYRYSRVITLTQGICLINLLLLYWNDVFVFMPLSARWPEIKLMLMVPQRTDNSPPEIFANKIYSMNGNLHFAKKKKRREI